MSLDSKLVRDQFLAASEVPIAERTAYLDARCGDDAELRAAVERLLAANEKPAGVIDRQQQTDTGPTQKYVAEEQPGVLIAGRYKLLQQIGEGGMGSVWMADQKEPIKRRVAVKLIRSDRGNSRMILSRFEAERQAIALMDHPNIARLLDAGTTEAGLPFFAMELVKGLPLTDYCDVHKLNIRERLALFQQICSAVQHAHQKGIIHRDLKPSNILIESHDGKPVPKIIDFGLAKATSGIQLTEHTLFTAFGNVMGTPLYMAPEQATFNAIDVDTRADVYSLGVILYELLTGTTPITRDTVKKAAFDELLKLIREQEAPKPSSRLSSGGTKPDIAANRNIDPSKLSHLLQGDLDWVVLKALEKDRTRRYETANGLAADIQRHLSNEPVMARPPSSLYRVQKAWQRNKFTFAASAAIVASLVIGIAASFWQAVRAEREATRAVAALDELRATAPAFAEQARALVARERFDEALEKLAYAAKLRPDAPEYLVATGDVLQCQLKLTDAAAAYRVALAIGSGDPRAEASAALCDELLAAPLGKDGKLTRESLSKLHFSMQQQQRPAGELMPVARLLGEEKKLIIDYWLARLRDLPISAERPLEKRLTVREDGLLALDLSDTRVTDLSPLAGAPLAALDVSKSEELVDLSPLRGLALIELNISSTSVADVAPLQQMHTLEKLEMSSSKVTDLTALNALHLEDLALDDTRIFDISALRGMKLKKLSLRGTRVSDLSPLAGMPLNSFDATTIPATDYSPLIGAPLEQCIIQNSPARDLSFLRDSPVKELCLFGCNELRDYSVLAGLKSLDLLILPQSFRSLPQADLDAIGALRAHATLRNIQTEYRSSGGWIIATTQSKEDFWQDWDREQTFVPALRKEGLAFSLSRLASGTYRLTLNNQRVSDLSILKGAPISELSLQFCNIDDLTPIQDLPLRILDLWGNPVRNLGPLREMPVEELSLAYSKVSDLSPLIGLPLEKLYLQGCESLTDVSALADIPTLVKLTVPIKARNVEVLRKLTKLKWLDFQTDSMSSEFPGSTTEEFWETWSHLSWLRALNDAGMAYTTYQDSEGMWFVTVTAADFEDCSIFTGGKIRGLTLNGTSVADISPLVSLPLETLNLIQAPVTDLSPLANLALKELKVNTMNVTDVSFLRSTPLCNSLEKLWLEKIKVSDYSPVAACQSLNVFSAWDSPLSDLAPLRGLPLKELYMAGSKVSDLSPLADMPLERIFFDQVPVTDITPLLSIPSLKDLILPSSLKNPGDLQTLPNLKRISFSYNDKVRGPSMTAQEFWKEFTPDGWLTRLRNSGFKIRALQKLPDGTWDVSLDSSQISDLTILSGAPISKLWLSRTAVSDLTPLRGMPLKKLALFNTKVSDLSPLEGIQLDYLNLTATNVVDISALRGMPLVSLRLNDCLELRDLSPLEGSTTLAQLCLPPNPTNFEFLRAFPKLERLSFKGDPSQSYNPDKTAAEFWQEYDATSK